MGNNRADVMPSLQDEVDLALSLGLTLSSGYRDNATTKRGTTSDHSYYPARAIDVSGSASAMDTFFRELIGRAGIRQAFYDPNGSILDGKPNAYVEGGHSDHVHVGGYVTPLDTNADSAKNAAERSTISAGQNIIRFPYTGQINAMGFGGFGGDIKKIISKDPFIPLPVKAIARTVDQIDSSLDFLKKIVAIFSDPIRLLEVFGGIALLFIGIRVLTQWVTASAVSSSIGQATVRAIPTPARAAGAALRAAA